MQHPSPHHRVRRSSSIGRLIADGIPAAFVLLMSAWTLAYWAGLAFRWPVEVIGALTVAELLVVLLGATWVRSRSPRCTPSGDQVQGRVEAAGPWVSRPPLRVLILVGYAVVVVLAVRVSRVLALLVLLLGAVIVLFRQWRLAGSPTAIAAPVDGDGSPTSRWWLPGLALAAIASAVLSTQVSRTDGDDVYFVGFSTYVAQHGLIPLRDTLISPQVFPAPPTYDPPLHSWETFIGLAARLSDVSAPLTTYSVVLPIMVVVAVLTLGRLIRESRVAWPLLGLFTALTLLLLDGADQATFGLLWLTRLWVGKTILVAVLVPMFIVYGHRWIRDRRPRDILMLVAAAVAALGVSSSAVFLIPLVLAAIMLAALVLRRVRAAILLLVPMLPPLAIGVLTVLLAPTLPSGPPQPLPHDLNGPDGALGAHTSDLLHLFVLGGWHLAVVLAAVTLGVLGLRSRTARTVVVALLAVFAVVVSPPGNALILRMLPVLDSVMWRMWFLVPLPLLLAALPGGVVRVMTGSVERLRSTRGPSWLWVARPLLAVLVAVGAAGGYALYGPSVLHKPAHRSAWLDYKADVGAQDAFDFVAAQARDGDVVLSPSASARMIPIATSRWFAVAPRLDYLRSGFYRSLPQVHAVDRLRLQSWVRGKIKESTEQVGHDLDLLDVDLVCTDGAAEDRAAQMRDLGWHRTAEGLYACFRRAN
jgi:hypothetical protein